MNRRCCGWDIGDLLRTTNPFVLKGRGGLLVVPPLFPGVLTRALRPRPAVAGRRWSRPAVAHDELVAEVEPQPATDPRRLGGEERLEDLRGDVRRDPRTGVADGDLHLVGIDAAGLDRDRALAVHGIGCVVDQVGPDL